MAVAMFPATTAKRELCTFSKTTYGSVSKPCTPVVHIKIAGKWRFIPLKMVLLGIDPYSTHIRPKYPPAPVKDLQHFCMDKVSSIVKEKNLTSCQGRSMQMVLHLFQ
jgi:hypothetical protein